MYLKQSARFFLGELLGFSLFIHENQLIRLLRLPPLILALFLATHRPALFCPPQLTVEVIRSLEKLCPARILNRSLAVLVEVRRVCAPFYEKATHLEMSPPGGVVKRGLGDQFIHVVYSFCMATTLPLVAYFLTKSSLFSLTA